MKSCLKKIKHKLKLWKNDRLSANEYNEFLKNERDFKSPLDIDSIFAEKLAGIKEFDLVNEELNGSLEKRFIMLDNYTFKNYLSEVKNAENETNYTTYISEEDIKNDTYPQKLSLLIKNIGKDYDNHFSNFKESTINFYKRAFSEVLSSRILNYFKCPTTYNRILIDDNIYIASLDFIKPHQQFYSINEISEKPVFTNYICSNTMEILLNKIKTLQTQIFSDNIKNKVSLKFPKCDKKKIVEDYIYSWLIRILLMGDTDFCSRNYGLIYDAGKNEIISAPNFDFEWAGYEIVLDGSFKAKYSWDFNVQKLIESANYIYNNYPNIYNKFIKNVKNLHKIQEKCKKELIEELVDNTIMEGFNTEIGIIAVKNTLKIINLNISEILKFDLNLQTKEQIRDNKTAN